MALYAISDLHLALNVNKPMDIFGDKWLNHEEKIKSNWIKYVKSDDVILIPGDISWGMKESESKDDLDWINKLPGYKIISKGNHDYWWGSITKLNKLYEKTKFLQNNYFAYNDYAICGTRGWISPESDKFTETDRKIYNREIIRLKLSLDAAKENGYNKFIVMLHYPPMSEKLEDSEFVQIFRDYRVEKVLYGHLHGMNLGSVLEGNVDGIEYIMTSSDYLDFAPKIILE